MSTMVNLAASLTDQDKQAEAETMYHELGKIQRRHLGPDHPDTLAVETYLAAVLSRQERFAEAEQVLRKALDRMKQALGDGHPHTKSAVEMLGSFKREEEAIRSWQEELDIPKDELDSWMPLLHALRRSKFEKNGAA